MEDPVDVTGDDERRPETSTEPPYTPEGTRGVVARRESRWVCQLGGLGGGRSSDTERRQVRLDEPHDKATDSA